jgi:recombination protein RecT
MEKQLSIAQYVANEAVNANIQQVLKEKTGQFLASVTSLVNSNEGLKTCDQGSILRACLIAASLDLPINQNLGFAYIIPYNKSEKETQTDEKGKEIVIWKKSSVAQFQMGYKGFIQLAQRSGQFKTINVTEVREGEIESNNLLTGEITFKWHEEGRSSKKIIGYVAYFKLLNGFSKILYMTTEELKAHGVKFSKTYKFGPWSDDFDSMAKKTCIKLLLSKYAPMTVDMQTAQLSDQAIIKDEGYEYADNKPLDHEELSQAKEDKRVLEHIKNAKTMKDLIQVQNALSDVTSEEYEHREIEIKEMEENE